MTDQPKKPSINVPKMEDLVLRDLDEVAEKGITELHRYAQPAAAALNVGDKYASQTYGRALRSLKDKGLAIKVGDIWYATKHKPADAPSPTPSKEGEKRTKSSRVPRSDKGKKRKLAPQTAKADLKKAVDVAPVAKPSRFWGASQSVEVRVLDRYLNARVVTYEGDTPVRHHTDSYPVVFISNVPPGSKQVVFELLPILDIVYGPGKFVVEYLEEDNLVQVPYEVPEGKFAYLCVSNRTSG